jgi:hypothetical protein
MNIDTSNRNEQRKFGALMAAAFALLGGIRWALHGFPLHPLPTLVGVLWALALAFAVACAVWPTALKPVFAAWMKLALAINWLVTHVILTLAFFVIMVPTACVLRLRGKDPLLRRWDSKATTYWDNAETQPKTPESYLNQF